MRPKLSVLVLIAALGICVKAQTSVFTYQGRLTDMSAPANGTYQMQFALYASATEGGPGIATVTNNAVPVAGGIFTVGLDFGAVEFTNSVSRWLEIRVKRSTEPPAAPFIILTPRQEITSAPYSLHAVAANGANSLTAACDECVTDSHMASVASFKITGTLSDAQVSDNLTINGGTINNTVIGGSTPASGMFTTITGDGSGLTNINGANIAPGSISAEALSGDAFPQSRNLAQLGSGRWDLLRKNVSVGGGGMVMDGVNLWMANIGPSVSKIRTGDGSILGTFPTSISARTVAFDGVNIWVGGSNGVQKLRASDGTSLGTFPMPNEVLGLAFDGTNIWLTIRSTPGIRRLRASDGGDLGTVATGISPFSPVLFDGEFIWVTSTGRSVHKLRTTDGAILFSSPSNTGNSGIAFDGLNVWVTNNVSDNVVKLRATDGMNLGTFTTLEEPESIVFDGENLWIGCNGIATNGVTKLRASDGANLGTFPVGRMSAIAFDGTNIWAGRTGTVKIPVFK